MLSLFGCNAKKSCSPKFDFCFFGKLLVAIPAVPLAGMIAASPFSEPDTRVVAGAVGCGIVIWLAMWVEHLPALSNMIFKRKK